MNKAIILGTANFNQKYGINQNKKKIYPLTILEYAHFKGIDTIDYAPKYFNNNKIFNYIKKKNFNIISKIPSINNTDTKKISLFIRNQVYKNLRLFNTKKIYCILFHCSDDFKLLKIKYAVKVLNDLKNKGLVKKIGVSVYNPNEIANILKKFKPYKPDIIQLPYNIYDNRFEKEKILRKLKRLKIEIHARSIFLQGLAFKKISDLPSYFDKWKKKLNKSHNFENKNIYSICYNYVNKCKHIDKIIIGFKQKKELKFFFKSIYKKEKFKLNTISPINDLKFVNPSLWKIKKK